MRIKLLAGMLAVACGVTALLPASASDAVSTALKTGIPSQQVVAQQLGAMPLPFTKNEGQWDERILFRTGFGSSTVWLCQDGIIYQSSHAVPDADSRPRNSGGPDPSRDRATLGAEPGTIESVVSVSFEGANQATFVDGEGETIYRCNYFLGSDQSRWRTDVPNYAAVVYRNVYQGIDLRVQGDQSGLQYLWTASSGEADLSNVALRLECLELVNGPASIESLRSAPWEALVRSAPMQSKTGSASAAGVSNSIPSDRQSSNEMTLVYSTYLGGTVWDEGFCIGVDTAGYAYVGGETRSADFPTVNPFDGDHNGGDYDVFVSKFSPEGDQLVYSTFLGGSANEHARDLAVDANGQVFVTGHTWSDNFPTQNAYQDTYASNEDGFVTAISALGNILVYSTYLGGNGQDQCRAVAIDSEQNAYLTGSTSSADFPIQGALDASYSGATDAFVTKILASGSSLAYSTFLGGTSMDFGTGISIDREDRACLTGYTESTDFPIQDAFDDSYNGGIDLFVARLSALGEALEYSTFLGGTDRDESLEIGVDSAGCTYVTGHTYSSDFPTVTPFDGVLDGQSDCFVTKLTAEGNALEYSTFLGGTDSDRSPGLAVDPAGRAYVTGRTSSSDFPTVHAYDASPNGSNDAFVTRLSSTGDQLYFSTYLGGFSTDNGVDIAVGTTGTIYVTGHTASADFPMLNPYDGTYSASSYNAFVAALAPPCICLFQSDLDASGFIDAVDLAVAIDVVFFGAVDVLDPYCPATRSDFNIDDLADAVDLALLIDHVFFGGPGPVDPCAP